MAELIRCIVLWAIVWRTDWNKVAREARVRSEAEATTSNGAGEKGEGGEGGKGGAVQGGAYSVTLLSDVADEFSGDDQEGEAPS